MMMFLVIVPPGMSLVCALRMMSGSSDLILLQKTLLVIFSNTLTRAIGL